MGGPVLKVDSLIPNKSQTQALEWYVGIDINSVLRVARSSDAAHARLVRVRPSLFRVDSNKDSALIESPCGSGKTLLCIILACFYRSPTVIVTCNEHLALAFATSMVHETQKGTRVFSGTLLDFLNCYSESDQLPVLVTTRGDFFSDQPAKLLYLKAIQQIMKESHSRSPVVLLDEVHRLPTEQSVRTRKPWENNALMKTGASSIVGLTG